MSQRELAIESEVAVQFGYGEYTYEVSEDWCKKPNSWDFGWVPGVACDSLDQVYVYSRSKHPLVVFDRNGKFVRTIGDDILKDAHGIFIDSEDNIFLTDWLDHCVHKFDNHGNLVLTLGKPGEYGKKDGVPFRKPTDAVTAPNGDIYVSDGYENARVHRFTKNGEYLYSWGEWGWQPSKFELSHCIRIDRYERLWVCDRTNDRIQLFDLEGNYLDQRKINKPDTIYFDPVDDIVYVAEMEHQVSVYTLEWELVSYWGGREKSNQLGYFSGCPHGIWMDSQGDLYVGQVQTNAGLQKFVKKSR